MGLPLREWAILYVGPMRVGRCYISLIFLVLGHAAGLLTMVYLHRFDSGVDEMI